MKQISDKHLNLLVVLAFTTLVINLLAFSYIFATGQATASGTLSFTVTAADDTTAPNIQFVSPTLAGGSTSNAQSIFVNITASDANLQDISLQLTNSSGLVSTNLSSSSPFQTNFTSLAFGTYYINASANDTSGNINLTENRTIKLEAAAAPSDTGGGQAGGGGGGGAGGGGSGGATSECTDDGDCSSGYGCDTSTNTCYTSCSSNSQCVSGYYCSSSSTCDEVECTGDSDCSGGYACDTSDYQCYDSCSSNNHCSSSYYCNDDDECEYDGGPGGQFFGVSGVDAELSFYELTIALSPGQEFTREIEIKNNGRKILRFDLSVENLAENIILSDKEVALDPGESKKINVTLSAPLDMEFGIYAGTIVAKAKSVEQRISVIMEVTSEVILFDSELVLFKKYEKIFTVEKKEIAAQVDIFDVGGVGIADVDVTYQISDFRNNVVFSESETVTVDEHKSYTKHLTLPELAGGEYVLSIITSYGDSISFSSQRFEIVEVDYAKFLLRYWMYFVIVLAILVVLWHIVTTHKEVEKYRKKKR